MEKSPIQKKLSWALGCALLGAALALAFPVEVTVEGLAAPVTAVGQALRGLSLSGGAGNAAAWGIVLLVSALPLVPWFLLRWRGRAVEDWLLVLLIPQVFALLYYAVNPTLIGSMAADFLPLAQMLAIVSTALTWLVLRFLRGMAEAEGTRLVSAVAVLLTGCALVLSLGAGAALAGDWRAAAEEAQAGNAGNAGFTVAVLGVLALLRLGPYLLGAAALLWGGRLVDQAGREPFARETAELCDRAAHACRTAAQGSVLLSLTVNLIQLALFDLLVQSNFSVSLDLLPLALAGAMFLLSRWMRQGLALREDNDSII